MNVSELVPLSTPLPARVVSDTMAEESIFEFENETLPSSEHLLTLPELPTELPKDQEAIDLSDPPPKVSFGGRCLGGLQKLGAKVLEYSTAFDGWSVSWAPKATLALAVLCAVISRFDGDELSLSTVLTTNLLVFWLWLRFIAWLGRLTDDDGNWSTGALWEDMRDRLEVAVDELRELRDENGLTKAFVLSLYAAQIGVLAILSGNWLRVVDVARTLSLESGELAVVWQPLVMWGSIVLCVGALVATIVIFRTTEADSDVEATTRADVGNLPAYVDLNRNEDICSDDKRIRLVLEVLKKWGPRLDYGNEKRHQQALLRRLRRKFGRNHVEDEYRLKGRRVDLNLFDSLFVELKINFKGTSKDERAYSQVLDYARIGDRPVLLVLFKSGEQSENAEHWFAKMHAEAPIVTIRMPYSGG